MKKLLLISFVILSIINITGCKKQIDADHPLHGPWSLYDEDGNLIEQFLISEGRNNSSYVKNKVIEDNGTFTTLEEIEYVEGTARYKDDIIKIGPFRKFKVDSEKEIKDGNYVVIIDGKTFELGL